jgi:hypothetical protein
MLSFRVPFLGRGPFAVDDTELVMAGRAIDLVSILGRVDKTILATLWAFEFDPGNASRNRERPN